MESPPNIAAKHSYSMRLVRPFLLLLRDYPGFPGEILQPLWEMGPDERLPVATLHELARGAIEMTGDEDLGLKAALQIRRGDFGALEYVASSAPTVGRAIEVHTQYLALVNDAIRTRVTTERGRSLIAFETVMPLPRAVADFQSAAFARAAQLIVDFSLDLARSEAWFVHRVPDDTELYAEVFPGFMCRYSMPFNGFAFDANVLERPMPAADLNLNQLIRQHAELMLQQLPAVGSFTQRVRQALLDELPGGNPNALRVASVLGTSSRTLTRRLAEEGTTFKDLLDELRHNLALSYVGASDHGFSEITLLLGYADRTAFYRAFKRWTGMTPGDYRRDRRAS